MFCFKVDTMLKEMETHCPLLLDLARKCWKLTSSLSGPGSFQAELNKNSFNKLPSISIDFAVMEKSKSIAVVSCDIGWSDIGSWNAVSDLTTQDSRGNSIKANTVVLHDVDNCHIQSDSRLIGAVGVKDLIIIDTRDALLVANKNSSQNVKQIFAKLKSDNHETHRTHVSENRPWGIYTTLEEGEGFKIKRIEVKPGGALSLQSHEHRSEHWIVVTGEATVHNDGKELTIKVNESTYIQAGHKHRLSNKTKENLVLIEVQVGSYLGEDDIKRYEDVYGRV
jgi:mannose-1-phosphate guanylyltransferase